MCHPTTSDSGSVDERLKHTKSKKFVVFLVCRLFLSEALAWLVLQKSMARALDLDELRTEERATPADTRHRPAYSGVVSGEQSVTKCQI